MSTATTERSISSMRRVKAYLRFTMRAGKLSGLAFVHAHKDTGQGGPGVVHPETSQIDI